ncbi:LysR family transcriptional regulator [Bordetella muralis]|uniref:LysR family transcriptional regulator n=1 Tax=Bordetella muralis TaxID=1649130 RepID=UPI0039EE860F
MELLQTMQIFATLAELGSFTKTADAAQIGRPQVTHAIQDLEAALGVRLVQRTTRKVNLTAEGEVFYERVTEILGNISEATSLFSTNGENARGRLRVDLPVALAQPRFMASLREFKRAYPDISLVLGVTDRTLDLVAEGVDCVVRIGELPNSSMIGRRIGTAAMVTCAAPDYLREYGHPESLEDLSRHHGVNYFSGNARKSMDWRFLIDGEEKIFNLRSGILVNDSNAYVEAGLAGFGIMQALGISVDHHLMSGSLVEVLPQCRPRSRPVSVLYPSKVHLAPQVRVFIDWVAEHFPQLHGDWFEA